MTALYWLSSRRITVCVSVCDGRIIYAAPVVRVFIGQEFTCLLDWMHRHGGFRWEVLT